jgi:hypothetical protein
VNEQTTSTQGRGKARRYRVHLWEGRGFAGRCVTSCVRLDSAIARAEKEVAASRLLVLHSVKVEDTTTGKVVWQYGKRRDGT